MYIAFPDQPRHQQGLAQCHLFNDTRHPMSQLHLVFIDVHIQMMIGGLQADPYHCTPVTHTCLPRLP